MSKSSSTGIFSASEKKAIYPVRIPGPSEKRKFSVMKFNNSLNVETSKWGTNYKIYMEREDNRAELGILEEAQDYGEGSEYGKAARDEARRKKYGRQKKLYNHDAQPWRLTMEESGKERKFRSIREGGAGDHADYWVFLKRGDDFVAHKVADWYQFLPCVTHRTLDIDQAEEQFQRRSRVMNQFALKAQIQKTLNTTDDDGEGLIKVSTLKIKDDYSDENDEESDGEGEGETQSSQGSQKEKKKKKNVKERKDKKQRVEHADEVAAYESEDGEDEGREYDYMSDSGSDSDRDTKTADEKVEEALVGVGDETGLKKQIGSEEFDESSDEEEEEEDSTKDDPSKSQEVNEELGNDEAEKKKSKTDKDDSSDSESDVDLDKNGDSVLFLKKETVVATSSSTSTGSGYNKRKGEELESSESKRMRVEEAVNSAVPLQASRSATNQPAPVPVKQKFDPNIPDGLNEDTVRKYLRRKPHTTKELLSRLMPKCPPDMNKAEIVTILASILKRIEPHQFKQKQGKKEVLFFSLGNISK
ncbi:hypothetical protein L596_003158 [Steinernema carpocapsae]|uniref:Transcription initiation factor IIF subunit alpha n=1 Tax=Steinernema carpocapsae TaxID=34508 RepID=A0A4U8UUJ7_STECR|nr:hypothetical protein L596_003158 [Steinernema carpocapsae]